MVKIWSALWRLEGSLLLADLFRYRARPAVRGAQARVTLRVVRSVVYGTDVYERDRIRNESLAFASSFTKIRVLTKIETNIH